MSSFDFSTFSEDHIYTGFWTNWSRGRVLGTTITLTNRSGALLIALLALFVSLVGTSLWRIACYALHYIYSTEAARDALHHQRQAILRNSANATYGLWSLIQAQWAWRQNEKVHRPYRRLLPLSFFTLVLVGSFATAGTFSSKIATSMGHEVLISSKNCGYLDAGQLDAPDELASSYWRSNIEDLASSLAYVLQCYASGTTNDDCEKFVKPRLSTKIVRNASCPFQAGICLLKDGNIIFDTGFLDTYFDLGLNTPLEDRLLIRRITSCAPLVIEGHKQIIQHDGVDAPFTRYLYGRSLSNSAPNESLTYEYQQFTQEEYNSTGTLPMFQSAYTLGSEKYSVVNGTMYEDYSSWEPISAFTSPDADASIFFLSASKVVYTSDVNDSWYLAHRRFGTAIALSGSRAGTRTPVIAADGAASPIACKVQHQYCNPSLPSQYGCSRLAGILEAKRLAVPLWHDEADIGWVMTIGGFYADHYEISRLLMDSALMSRFSMEEGQQWPIPNNQWQLDLEHMYNISLAYLQWLPVSVAKGPSDPSLLRIKSTPAPTSTSSVFGLVFTLALGTTIIALSYALSSRWWAASSDGGATSTACARLEWATNKTLQLQRLAHEELGIGPWTRCLDAVPTTPDGRQRLAVLDVADREHPRLKGPAPGLEKVLSADAGGGGVERRSRTPTVVDTQSAESEERK